MSCRKSRCRQRGTVVMVVVVCMAVAVALSVVVVGQMAAERRAEQMAHRKLQASWLAEAGIERAAARLAADSEYGGETWTISAGDLAKGDGATVKIQVETVAGQPEQRSLRVEVDYRDTPEDHCRKVRQILVDRDAILSHQSTTAPNEGRPANGGSS